MKASQKLLSYDPATMGITQGLLNRWRNCREDCWLFLQGWSSKSVNKGLTFGNLIHAVLEKIYQDLQKGKLNNLPDQGQVLKYIAVVEKTWELENPRATKEAIEQKEASLLILEAIMPIYFEFWHKDLKELPWIGVEHEFKVPYKLMDGRTTFLRGKMDGIFKRNGIWLFETKSKARIDESTLVDVLPLDFQNNFYIVCAGLLLQKPLSGVKYNIVRRSQMEQKKDETVKGFSERMVEDIRKRPEFYFIRYEIAIDQADQEKFKLDLLNQVTEFYDWWDEKIGHYPNPSNCETKYGRCWALEICSAKNYQNHQIRPQVFNELSEDL